MTDAKEYGKALFLITEEDGTTERVLSEVTLVEKLLSSNPEYTKLLDTPALVKEERVRLIDESFGSFDTSLCNLIKILCERREVHLLPKVCESYSKEYDTSRGIERVDVITAIPLTDSQAERLKERLGALTGKTVIINNIVEPSTLGGVKLRYSGIQLDGSIKTRLQKFEEALCKTVI